MDFSQVKAGDKLKYGGDSNAFGGTYRTYAAEETYLSEEDCPEHIRGILLIIELMNDDTPMFFALDSLNPNEWQLVQD